MKLWQKRKKSLTPSRESNPGPSKRGWCSTIEPPRQATSPASLFKILSVLPPLHNMGIIQCPHTKPASLGEPVAVAIVHRARPKRIVIKGINAKSEIFKAQTEDRRERKREGKEEEEKERRKEGGKGNWKWSFGRNGKNRKRPSRESNPGPQQTRLMLYHWATETSDITS